MDVLRLSGSIVTQPTSGSPSGDPEIETPVTEQLALTNKAISNYTLTADAPVSIDFCGLAQVNYWMIKSVGGDVTLGVTSAAGADQKIPVGTFGTAFNQTIPITAMTLTRSPGINTTVRVIIGERA